MARHAHHEARDTARVALLTVSDTRTPENDVSGATARRLLEEAGHRVVDYRILRDEPAEVRDVVGRWLKTAEIDVVFISGGTGISGRDRTYEAVSGLLEKTLDGFGEIFRRLSFDEIGSAAMLSRAVGGIAGGKAVFAVPGATAAVELALERLIVPELAHLISELRK